jgi:hypothetical protein
MVKDTSQTRRYAMADERTLASWHVEWKGDAAPHVVDADGQCVAVVHGPDKEETLKRAMLIAAAPGLRDATWFALGVFDGMAQDSTDPDVKTAATEITPVLLAALRAAGMEITKAEDPPA